MLCLAHRDLYLNAYESKWSIADHQRVGEKYVFPQMF